MVETRENKVKSNQSEAEDILADVRLEARRAEVALSKALHEHLHGLGTSDWNSVALHCDLAAARCRRVLLTQRAVSEALAAGVPDEIQAPATDTEKVLSGVFTAFPLLKRSTEERS